ncbi:MAG: hypothetical protein JWO73_840 [Candidatus Taylorbacteria bacterium]|nr:hypothetical protein [Candidatus Taylorbacteria bacterium]
MNNARSSPLPITLVDILHDTNGYLLVRPEIEKPLYEKVLSQVTLQTKVCVEGLNTGVHGLLPTNLHYPGVMQRFWPNYAQIVPPMTLYGGDPRCRVGFAANARVMGDLDKMLTFLDQNLEIHELPTSIDEAVEWVKKGKSDFSIKKTPDRKMKELADSLFRLEKTWQKNYADLAAWCTTRGKEVYLIAGLSHILSLHAEHGWPIMWLTREDPWITPENVYRAGMNLTHFLDHIRRM